MTAPLRNPRIPNPSTDLSCPLPLTHQIDFQLPPLMQRMSSIPYFQSQQCFASSQIAPLRQHYGSLAAVSAIQQHAGLHGGQVGIGAPPLLLQTQWTPQQQHGLQSQAQFSIQQPMSLKTGVGQPIQSNGMIYSMDLNKMQHCKFAQQSLNPGIRQAQSYQGQSGASQKLIGQCNSQASKSPQLRFIAQDGGQAVMLQSPSTQQELQMTVGGVCSPFQIQQQRYKQSFLQQQPPKSRLLTQEEISRIVQQQGQFISQQQQLPSNNRQFLNHLPSLQTQQQKIQQQQQQQSPEIILSPTESQPEALKSNWITTSVGGSSHGTVESERFVGKRKIGDLVSQVDPQVKLDPDVEDLLLKLADDFIDQVTDFSCNLAKHRKSSVLELKDLLPPLEQKWHLSIPGYTRG